MREEVRGEDYLVILWGDSVYEVRFHKKRNDFVYNPTALCGYKADAHFIGFPWEKQILRIEPLPGKEEEVRKFIALGNLKNPNFPFKLHSDCE